jgi:YbbR domain-containing protein
MSVGSQFRTGLFDNLYLKGFALLLAVGLWSVVPDPSVLHIVPGVPVQLDGIPVDLALAEAVTATLDVTLRGSALRTRDLRPGQLAPLIDMLGLFEGDNTVLLTPDMINVPFGVTVESIDPPRLTVSLERRVRRDLAVNVVVEGSPHGDYQIYDKLVEPASIPVNGPASRMAELDTIATEKVGVTGRQESLVRTVRVIPEDPRLRLEGPGEVQVTIAIEERPVNFQLQGIEVHITGAVSRVVVNPSVIGVVLEGPPSAMAILTTENFTVMIDVAGLAPRAEDYRIEPVIRLEPAELARRVRVIAITPQRRLDVHVFGESQR